VVTAKVAINGFGRIGRNVLRALAESGRDDVQVVAINDLAPPATNAHLFRYDSVHGRFPGEARLEGDTLQIRTAAGKTLPPIKVLAERDLAKLPWGQVGADIVMECTGIFTSKEKASGHLQGGAKKVIVSAPADGADLTVVYGVNHDQLKAEHTVISNASCTTNCLAPVAKVLNDLVGIERGHMTTIHSFTNDQNLLDVFHKDLYRARAATASMIPTSTGAAKAVGLVLPELNEAIKAAASSGPLKGILSFTEEPLVSIDFNHYPASSTVDLKATKVLEGKLCRIASWYDNEWGFSNRMCDTAALMGSML
jgi:glyceraldehyde 3-phosphate dehydrogenase